MVNLPPDPARCSKTLLAMITNAGPKKINYSREDLACAGE
jgi:hypothetical protein